MKPPLHHENRNRTGAALLYAVFAAFAAAVMVSTMMTLSLASNENASTRRRGNQAKYLAEGAIEVAKSELAKAVANWQAVPQVGTVSIDGVPVSYEVTPTGFSTITSQAGLQTLVDGYEVTASASVHGHAHTSNRLVNTEAQPIFQFAAFYDQDLELNPGVNMTLQGRIHSNSDIYLTCNQALTLDSNYLRAVGDMYRHRKDGAAGAIGPVRIRKWVADPFDPSEPKTFFNSKSQSVLAGAGVPSSSGYDSDFTLGHDANNDGDFDDPGDWHPWASGALKYWSQQGGYSGGSGYTVMTSDHGVSTVATPTFGSIEMYSPAPGGAFYFDASTGQYQPAAPGMGTHDKGFYHEEADLSVITYADQTIKVYDENGADITTALPGVASLTQIYDARQAGTSSQKISATRIDLEQLKYLGAFPANGLLYAASYDSGPGLQMLGVELVNGSHLASPLTVASENSLYITGDYNTVNKKGAAVIGDAVNLLSSSWVGSKKKGALPKASATTYNVAMITGNMNTTAGAYNGGLENLPRLHEDWDQVTLTLRGSFVNTWMNKYATGEWGIGGYYYKAPIRNFSYDVAFNTVANLPPYTPMAVRAVDVAVW